MARTKMVSPLKGVIRCGHCGCSMGPTYARKNGRHYTYYIRQKDGKRTVSRCPLKRISGGDIEQAVIGQLSAVFRTPTLVANLLRDPGHRSGGARAAVQAERPTRDGTIAGAGASHRIDETRQRSAGQGRDADDRQPPGGRVLETTAAREREMQSPTGRVY